MAVFNKAHAIKAVLLAGFLLIIFNILNNHLDNHLRESFSFSRSSSEWPITKVANIHSPLISNISTHNVYTILFNSDNNTLKNVRFNVPSSYNNYNNETHSNSILLVDSTDFKRKFNLNKISNNNKQKQQNQLIEFHHFHNSEDNNDYNNNESQLITNIDADNVEDDEKVNENDVKLYDTSSKFISAFMTKFGLKIDYCPLVPSNLEGPIKINTTMESMEDIEQYLLKLNLNLGGWYKPSNCKPRDNVAIIVPFRDRYAHLPVFLKNIHPFLIKQQIHYRIYLIEQTNGKPFNRAALMNIGYLEALKQFKWDCFIFHDVDLLPLDDRNLYTCPDQPRHMSVAIDIFGYKLPYTSIFGGVSAMTTSQFQKVNGFSNSFWGWGGEDDDMSNRLKHANFHISRYPINVARYMMLNHQKEKANPKRFENLVNGAKKFETDGLNSVKYDIYSFKKFPLFTWYLVELKMTEQNLI